MSKERVRDIRDMLQNNRNTYQSISHDLSQEQHLARAERDAARQALEPVLAGFVSRLIPAADAPAVASLHALMSELGLEETPQTLREARHAQNAQARRNIAGLDQTYGSAQAVSAQISQLEQQLKEAKGGPHGLQAASFAHETLENKLHLFDEMNARLHDKNLPRVIAADLPDYARPASLIEQGWRWLTDSSYRTVRPVLDRYEQHQHDLPDMLGRRDDVRMAYLTRENDVQQMNSALARASNAQRSYAQAQASLSSPKEIVSEMRSHVTDTLLSNPAAFTAVKAAFADQLPPEAGALHTRMQLFGTLADNIGKNSREVSDVIRQLDKPLYDLNKAVRNSNGSKKVKFDLHGKQQSMAKHQTLLQQRVKASGDIRSAARSETSTSYYHQDNSNDLLLWYLILSDNHGPAQAAAPAFASGAGGEFGGAGAQGQWGEAAANSYFRADLLGVTPDNAKDFGLDASQLRIAPEVLQDLGVSPASGGSGVDLPTSSDFNSLSHDSSDKGIGQFAAGAALASGFNDLGQGMQFETPTLDLGSQLSDMQRDLGGLTSDLGSIGSDIASSIGSIDTGSSYSCDSGGSFDCGGGGGGGFD